MIQNLEKDNSQLAEAAADESQKLRQDIEMLIKENDAETEKLNEQINVGKQEYQELQANMQS